MGWSTNITKVEPNHLVTRGYRQEDLIGNIPYPHVVYLLLKGDLPSKEHGHMIDAILTACIDHGVTPPSSIASRIVRCSAMSFAIPLVIVDGILAWVLRPGTKPANPRKLAILATVIPSVMVAIVSVVYQLLHNFIGKVGVSDIANTVFIVGLGLIGAAILALAGFTLMRRWEVSKGIGFGCCIVVFLSVIEFAMLEWLAGV